MAFTMKTVSARPVAAARVVAPRAASRPLWLPGSTPPKHLDGSLPGDYGFDPLNLAAPPGALKWNQQSEIFHCRVAMIAVAGILIPGAIIPGFAQWYDAGEKALAGSPFPYATLVAIEIFLVGWAESKRWMDIRKPGSQGEPGSFLGFEGMLKGTDQVGYPGGPFNPMGMGTDNMKEMQTKEIKNGRLAMVAFIGFVAQHAATGKGPLQALGDHLADPWANNFATNGVSIPTGNLRF